MTREKTIEGGTRSAPHPTLGGTFTVDARLYLLNGNTRPYFSVTCWFKKGREEWGGASHDEILAVYPELAPVVALHLSDDTGAPMHTEANGLYWLGFGRYSDLNLDIAAKHFRVTPQEAADLRQRIMSESGYDPEAYEREIEAMRVRWQAEADTAVQILRKWATESEERIG